MERNGVTSRCGTIRNTVPFILFIAVFLLIALFSWLAFFQASADASLIYQPLKSYFLPVKLDPDSPYYAAADWFLATNTKLVPTLNRIIHELSVWLIVFSLLGIFIYIIQKRSFEKLELKHITFISIITATIAVFCLPIDSSDLFGYIARGAQQVYYSINPFAHTVSEIENWRQDPLLANMLWQNNPSPYGPLFKLLCRIFTQIGSHNLWLSILIFKFANLLMFIATLKVLEHIIVDKELFPEANLVQQKLIYTLFALNPFIITEAIWNAHNDIYMGLGILLGIYFCYKCKYNLALIFLVMSSLIKYLSVVLIPLVLIQSYRDQKRIPFLGLALGAVFSYCLVIHYELLTINYQRISENISLSHKSLFDGFNSLSKYISGQDLPAEIKYIFLGGFVVFAFISYYRFAKQGINQNLFKSAFWLMFVLLCICSPKFHSWYMLMFLPLGLIVHPRLMLILSCTHMLSLTFLDQANIANFLIMTVLPLIYYYKSAPSK